jgi:hypothetical protein
LFMCMAKACDTNITGFRLKTKIEISRESLNTKRILFFFVEYIL